VRNQKIRYERWYRCFPRYGSGLGRGCLYAAYLQRTPTTHSWKVSVAYQYNYYSTYSRTNTRQDTTCTKKPNIPGLLHFLLKFYVTVREWVLYLIFLLRLAEYISNNIGAEQLRCAQMSLGFYLDFMCVKENVETLIKALAKSTEIHHKENTKVQHEDVTQLFRATPIKNRFFKLKMERDGQNYYNWYIRLGFYKRRWTLDLINISYINPKSTLPICEWIRYPNIPADSSIKSDVVDRADTGRLGYLFGDDNPNIFKTVKGWWWNNKTKKGYLNRPIAKDVSFEKTYQFFKNNFENSDYPRLRLYESIFDHGITKGWSQLSVPRG